MSKNEIWLPAPGGELEFYIPRAVWSPPLPDLEPPDAPVREIDAAVHVVVNPQYGGSETELDADVIDWKTTAQIREHIWSSGLGVADGMDTAQRDILPQKITDRLLRQTAEQANGRRWYFGAGTDAIRSDNPTNNEIARAYIRQIVQIQRLGGKVAVFPSPHLAGRSEADFMETFTQLDAAAEGPLLAHWLGEMFNPAMKGYFPGTSFYKIMELPNFESAKISLLDAEREIEIRRRLAKIGKIVKTGDDFHYVELIEGTDEPIEAEGVYESDGVQYPLGDYSHALLGCMGAFETVAEQALNALAQGDVQGYRRRLLPTAPLSYWLFQSPTAAYKHGVAAVAMLQGKQDNCLLLPNNPTARPALHIAHLFKLMDGAGLFSEEQARKAYRQHIQPLLR